MNENLSFVAMWMSPEDIKPGTEKPDVIHFTHLRKLKVPLIEAKSRTGILETKV